MSGSVPRVLSALEWLLRRVATPPAASAAIGDIYEELSGRCTAGRPPRWSAVWVNAQAVKELAAVTVTAAGRTMRVTGVALRDAARAVHRAPGHARSILVMLAIGIAAATVTFSVVDAVVLRSLPFERS